MRRSLSGLVEFDLRDVRGAAVAMLGAAAVLPLLPGHAGLRLLVRALRAGECLGGLVVHERRLLPDGAGLRESTP